MSSEPKRCVCGSGDIRIENTTALGDYYLVSCTACLRRGPEQKGSSTAARAWNEMIDAVKAWRKKNA